MQTKKRNSKQWEIAGVASVQEGVVVLEGPDGVAVTMTGDAAADTARNLLSASSQLLGTRVILRKIADQYGNDDHAKKS